MNSATVFVNVHSAILAPVWPQKAHNLTTDKRNNRGRRAKWRPGNLHRSSQSGDNFEGSKGGSSCRSLVQT